MGSGGRLAKRRKIRGNDSSVSLAIRTGSSPNSATSCSNFGSKKYVPGYMFLVGFVIAMVTLLKGLKHIGLSLSFGESLTYSIAIGFVIALIGTFFLRKIENTTQQRGDVTFDGVEKVFAVLMVFTACAMAFAHGSNDVANAVGPLAAIASVVQSGGEIAVKSSMPWWILLLGATGIVAGLATLGYKVIDRKSVV